MNSSSTNITTTIINNEEEEGGFPFTPSEIVFAMGVGLLMVGIGASIERELFLKMCQSRKAFKAATVGICCQFAIMPVLTYVLAIIFGVSRISPYATLGFVLVGCMPGGGSSNIWTVWTGGVLELSVFMTLVSTILSFGLTPFWLWLFSTQAIGLDAQEIAFDQIGLTFALLVIPLGVGWALNWKLLHPKYKNKIVAASSALAMLIFIATIVLVGLDYPNIFKASNWQYYLSAMCLFPISATISYVISHCLFRLEPAVCRTIVMEVGFQNMPLAISIGSVMVTDEALLSELILFPMFYVIFNLVWAAIMVPLAQLQKRYNKAHNVTDLDPNFFAKTTENDEDENQVVGNTMEDKRNDTDESGEHAGNV